MAAPLRLVVYDATQQTRPPVLLGLTWNLGSRLYRAAGRVDASYGATSFGDMFAWLSSHDPDRSIEQIQFWGHGKWGRLFIDREFLDASSLVPGGSHYAGLVRLVARLAPNALLWFRSCETLGAAAGQDFARRLADFAGARIAGHTYTIGFFQSGLHSVTPGVEPAWAADEGLASGTPRQPVQALVSRPGAPNTITCLASELPEGF